MILRYHVKQTGTVDYTFHSDDVDAASREAQKLANQNQKNYWVSEYKEQPPFLGIFKRYPFRPIWCFKPQSDQ